MRSAGSRPDDEHNQLQRRYFENSEQRTLTPTGSLYLRRHVDAMIDFAGIRAGDRVLELGCGMGRYTFILAERGVAVEGLDLSPELLRRMKAHDSGRHGEIPLHAHDILDCPPEMFGAFDAVIGFFVLHHVHDLDACIAVAAKLVRPGGRAAFLEPNPSNPLYYLQIFLTPEMSWHAERGMLRMRRSQMYPTMENAGLTNLSFRRFGFFPPFITNRRLGARLESGLERVPMWQGARPFQLFGGELPSSSTHGATRTASRAGLPLMGKRGGFESGPGTPSHTVEPPDGRVRRAILLGAHG